MKLNPIATIACASVLVSQVVVSSADETYGVGEFGVLVGLWRQPLSCQTIFCGILAIKWLRTIRFQNWEKLFNPVGI